MAEPPTTTNSSGAAVGGVGPPPAAPAPPRATSGVVDPLADFIVIAEFSEKEGPIARAVLGPPRERFPIDSFVLRIMSVELSVEGHEKWSVWLDWAAQGIEALVVHFQLQDLAARGYVRPLAIAYLSSYPLKLMHHRPLVLRALYEAADAMLLPNQVLYRHDIQQRLQDLREMLTSSAADAASSAEAAQSEVDSDAVRSGDSPAPLPKDQILDTLEELEQLWESLPTLSTVAAASADPRLVPDNSAAPVADPVERRARIESLQRKNSLYDKYLRNLDELSNSAFSGSANTILSACLRQLQHQPQVLLHDRMIDPGGNLRGGRTNTVEYQAAAPHSALLSVGPTPILNFHLDAESHFLEINSAGTELELSPRGLTAEDEAASSFDNLYSIAAQLWPSTVVGGPAHVPQATIFAPFFALAQKSAEPQTPPSPSSSSGQSNQPAPPLLQAPQQSAAVPAAGHAAPKPLTLLELLRGRFSWMKHALFSLMKGRTLIILAEAQNALAVSHIVDLLHAFVPGSVGSAIRPRVVPWWPATPTTISFGTEPHSTCAIGGDIRMPHLSWLKLVGVDKRTPLARIAERYISIWDWEADTLRAPAYNLDEADIQASVPTNTSGAGTAPSNNSSASLSPSSNSGNSGTTLFTSPYLTPQPGGRILDALLHAKKSWPSNSTFRAHIHHILLTELAMKAAIYYHECGLAVPPSAALSSHPHRLATLPKSRSMTDLAQHGQMPTTAAGSGPGDAPSGLTPAALNSAASLALRERVRAEFFLRMNIMEQDAEIMEYLAELVKFQQQSEQQRFDRRMTPNSQLPDLPIRLDFSPTRLFKNTSSFASGAGSTAPTSSAAAAIASMMI